MQDTMEATKQEGMVNTCHGIGVWGWGFGYCVLDWTFVSFTVPSSTMRLPSAGKAFRVGGWGLGVGVLPALLRRMGCR